MILYYSQNDKLIWQMKSISEDLDREIKLQNLQAKNLIENQKNINFILNNSKQLNNKSNLESLLNNIKTNLENSKKIVADLTILKDITEKLSGNVDQGANLNLYNSYAKACQENIYINKQNIEAINIKYAKELNLSLEKLIATQKEKISVKGQEYFVEINNISQNIPQVQEEINIEINNNNKKEKIKKYILNLFNKKI